MKKIILWILVYILAAAIAFGCTYAYLIVKDEANNKFKVGETIVTVEEEFKHPTILAPGVTFAKKPWATNKGNLPCFVRMRADFSDKKAQDFCQILGQDPNWVYDTNDGYYYYNKILLPGEKTPPVFTSITIKGSMTDMIDFDILVYAEAIQHTDHSGVCPTDEYKTVWN